MDAMKALAGTKNGVYQSLPASIASIGFSKGAFTYYVSKIWPFLDPLLPLRKQGY